MIINIGSLRNASANSFLPISTYRFSFVFSSLGFGMFVSIFSMINSCCHAAVTVKYYLRALEVSVQRQPTRIPTKTACNLIDEFLFEILGINFIVLLWILIFFPAEYQTVFCRPTTNTKIQSTALNGLMWIHGFSHLSATMDECALAKSQRNTNLR